jgi:aspartyl-tRNA(Asn)/glutamyl-tRNA(Gln) amidotransferase subunit C
MSITETDVRKIAKLSRIRLKDEEVENFTDELGKIIQWVEMLQSVDTDDVDGMTSVSHSALPQRRDEVTDGDKQAQVIANAPDSQYNCFVVPKVIEE